MANLKYPLYPIIYVRGYAMTPDEIDATTADPFCGFNLGSTVYRAVAKRREQPRKFVFQSPVVRLASDYGYQNVYQEGRDILDPEWHQSATGEATNNKLPSQSIIIFRYYDEASRLLGIGKTPSMETFARELSELVARVRDLVCANTANKVTPNAFKCYLVAHSMGGLVCRAFLQNPNLDSHNSAQYVDKVFTYATPHNGIEMASVNIPRWLTIADMHNFDRAYMAKYLGLTQWKAGDRVDLLPENLAQKFFCMVGTNRSDYDVALGLSRTFVGHGSDGLVKIENATLHGMKGDGKRGEPCAKAFTYRSHSGHFGIVNSEEGYQNLVRFLFGDIRVDIWLDITNLELPSQVATAQKNKKKVDALYQVEVLAAPRGKLWYLTRRIAEEDSVTCISHSEWVKTGGTTISEHLSTAFLSVRSKVDSNNKSLAYSVVLGIRVPDYEIENILWLNEHYEGGYLFRDTLLMKFTKPETNGEKWTINAGWLGTDSNTELKLLSPMSMGVGKVEVRVSLPSDQRVRPRVDGQLRFVVSTWNQNLEVV